MVKIMALTVCAFFLANLTSLIAGEQSAATIDNDRDLDIGDAPLWTAKEDAAFLSGMIAHHRGAIHMSQALLGSTDPQIRDWSQKILTTQRREVELMEALLANIGPYNHQVGGMMDDEMKHMMELELSDDADVNYIIMMIPHHAGAIDMALPALVMSDNTAIIDLAENIIRDQAKEIAGFRQWLMSKGFTASDD